MSFRKAARTFAFAASTAAWFAVSIGAVACRPAHSEPEGGPGAGAPKLPVDVITLQEQQIPDGAIYLAQLISRHQVALYPQVVGAVSAILVKPGDVVKAGAPLVQIDPRRDAAALAQLQAQKAQKKAAYDLAKTVEQRSKSLMDQGLLGKAQYDQDKSLLDVAEQELKAQDAAINAQGVQLGYYRIIAPFDGVVGDIPVKLGDLVVAGSEASLGTKITSIADNTRLEAYVNLPVEKLPLLNASSHIDVLDATGKKSGEAPVAFISQETNPLVQSVLIKGTFENPDAIFRAGQVTRARVVFSTHPGVRVPVPAVVRMSGQYFAFVVEDGAQGAIVHQKPIEVGELDDNAYAVVKGLSAGDRIAITQLQKLREGAPIDPKAPSPASSASASASTTAP
jgi:RND family efflux transporter MFP subunit